MDSQDPHQLSCSQQLTSDTQHILLSDSPNSKYDCNSSQFHPQAPMPQLDQFSNQFTPLNLQFQPNFPFNPMSAPFPTHVQQQFGSGFSFQGLMNAPILPFKNQTSNSSKRSKNKRDASKKFQTSQPPILRRNWTIDEDVALTKAWLYISVDADVGTDQKCGKLWNRILEVWRDNMGEYDITRNPNALGCRWGTIQGAVNKFHGLYEQLERHPRSGTTLEDMKREAMRMYKDLNDGQPFKYEHCWEIMKNNPKWCSQQLTKSGASKKQKSVDGSSVDSPPPLTKTALGSSFSDGDDSINLDTPAIETINSDEAMRPHGRKAAKEKKKRVVAEKGVIDVLTHLQCTLDRQFEFNREELELKKERDKKEYELREQTMKMEMEFKERNQKMKEKAQKRKDQERILNQDLTKLQPALREAFERIQTQILNEWENDGLFGEVSKSDDVGM